MNSSRAFFYARMALTFVTECETIAEQEMEARMFWLYLIGIGVIAVIKTAIFSNPKVFAAQVVYDLFTEDF